MDHLLFLYDDHSFKSINGITVESEYMKYNGNGGNGMRMFLFDASVQAPAIGASGTPKNLLHKQILKIMGSSFIPFRTGFRSAQKYLSLYGKQ